jgi:hypothetical protein
MAFGAYLRGLEKGGSAQPPFPINAGLQAIADARAFRAYLKAREREAERAAAPRRRRAATAAPYRCPECREHFEPTRRDQKFCGKGCRQAASRARKTS